MEDYDIYIRGFAMRDEPPELGLQRVFGIDAQRARELVLSLPRVVKRRVAAEHVPRYEQALQQLGADYELRMSPLRPRQIALVGTPNAPRPRDDESGLLTLPPEPAPSAGARGTPRFSQTVVGNLDPAPAPRTQRSSTPAPLSVHDPAPNLGATRELRVSARPPAAPRSGRPSTPAHATWSAPDLPSGAGWTALKSSSVRPQDAGEVPPPPPAPTNIGLGGRPDWLVDATDAYHASAPQAEPTMSVRPGSTAPGMRVSVTPVASVRPAPPQPRPQVQFSAGGVFGKDVAGSALPLPLRVGARIAIGAILFVAISALRHCHTFDRGIESELARWNASDAAHDAAASPHAQAPLAGNEALGPIAHDWMQSDLNVFTNGDKDRVTNMITRFEQAGAVEVHVAHIMKNGVTQIAGELVVVLPRDPITRKAVFAVYEAFLRGTFGNMIAAPKDDGGDQLRVAL